jgi:hypothetical protein
MTDLRVIVSDFAAGLKLADSRRPQAVNARSGQPYSPGIGPHSEAQTIKLVVDELLRAEAVHYAGQISIEVPYPVTPRSKCDLCLGQSPDWEWAVEVKMLRLMGDNGKPNDNILMHLLSPYPQHRSALTDCTKLVGSGLRGRKAILIYGYDYDQWPMITAVEAFEDLARTRVRLSQRFSATVEGLIHPVHLRAGVFAWEVAKAERTRNLSL